MGVEHIDAIDLSSLQRGETKQFWLRVSRDEIGEWHRVPVIVMRGAEEGPVVGLTAVIHGDEINGMHTIFEVMRAAPSLARGTIIGVPLVNVAGFRRGQRVFADRGDLNRFVNDELAGRPAQRFMHRFLERVVAPCDVLLDLHTAGPHRRNIFYARVDCDDEPALAVARTIAPSLIAHKPAREGSLRHGASSRGIPAVVLEIGDSATLQPQLAKTASMGIVRYLASRDMVASTPEPPTDFATCRDTGWIRSTAGGTAVLEVAPGDRVDEGALVGTVLSVFGQRLEELRAPYSGIVIGTRRHPMAMEGTPLVHVGAIEPPREK